MNNEELFENEKFSIIEKVYMCVGLTGKVAEIKSQIASKVNKEWEDY